MPADGDGPWAPVRGVPVCAVCGGFGAPEAEGAGAVVVLCPGPGDGGAVHDATANSAASAAAVRGHAMPECFLGVWGRLVV